MSDWLDGAKKKSEEDGKATEKEYAPTWKPNEGDMLAGTVVRGDYVDTKNGAAHLLIVKDEETDDEWTVWCSAFMLKQAIIDLAPAEGSLVVIQFHGKKPSKKDSSRSFNHFTMQVEKSDYEYWATVFRRYQSKAEQMRADGAAAAPEPSHFGPDEAPF